MKHEKRKKRQLTKRNYIHIKERKISGGIDRVGKNGEADSFRTKSKGDIRKEQKGSEGLWK